ncbi:MAG: SdiA-regulated domain-containing protein, partial [Bacteroidota bacterium]|nr:SdiA-regulated domain-containing protein [Bacteroidota bacterium]
LKTKKLLPDPVIKVNLTDPLLAPQKSKKLEKAFQPSEIGINPQTGTILVTEGSNPQLFTLKPNGKIEARYKLSSSDFPQPEGITFSPTGELFISSEGNKQAGSITQVRLKM